MKTYEEQMREDLTTYIKDNDIDIVRMSNDPQYLDRVYDDILVADEVIGNGSGSYFFSRAKAKEQVLFDGFRYFNGLRDEDGYEADYIISLIANDDWETLDVMIRGHICFQVLYDIVEEHENDSYIEQMNAECE